MIKYTLEDKLYISYNNQNIEIDYIYHNFYNAIIEIITYINTHDEMILVIDGKCGSGKTTLAKLLSFLDCNIFSMDDYFLQKHQRTNERFLEPGGNVDYERFKDEVVDSIVRKEDIIYQPFNCQTMSLKDKTIIKYKPINIIEGTYSMHPYFKSYYDLSIFIDIDDHHQIERIQLRNPDRVGMFIEKWIPLENKYFNYYHIQDKVNIKVKQNLD